MKITPYKGDKPYIFISYAHKDSDMVLPILQRMQEDGYRIWMDEGIDPGTEWDEFIAEKLDESSHFIAFLSQNYLDSSNCKDELNYARDLEKPRLLIYLEELVLPRGMAMRLNRLQSIFHHRYAEEDKFFEKLYQAEGIASFCEFDIPAPKPLARPSAPKVSAPVKEVKPRSKKTSVAGSSQVSPTFHEAIADYEEDLKTELLDTASRLVQTMDRISMPGEIVSALVGGYATCFEVRPAPQTKVSNFKKYEADFALALSAMTLRIIAPIPGKALVGFEVPNKTVRHAFFSDLIKEKSFWESSKTSFCLGRDMVGKPVMPDIKRMPHLLIGGSTGSGKSVCLYTMLLSLVKKNSPAELRLLLIDPKQVEFTAYEKLPHLYTPVIHDVKRAGAALEAVYHEMEHRYELLHQSSSRNLDEYNAKTADTERLPRLLVVVDEIADLMFYDKNKNESRLIRLLQKGRAVGVHLVITTQRPSVDVITGMLKANIPARIAFRTVSSMDSRVLLDEGGAEKLMPHGDLIFSDPTDICKQRVQGAFISYEEMKEMLQTLSVEAPCYDENFAEMTESLMNGAEPKSRKAASSRREADTDPRSEDHVEMPLITKTQLKEILETVVTVSQISVAYLQRRFSLGYGRAASIMNLLVRLECVEPYNGRGYAVKIKAKDIPDILAQLVGD